MLHIFKDIPEDRKRAEAPEMDVTENGHTDPSMLNDTAEAKRKYVLVFVETKRISDIVPYDYI